MTATYPPTPPTPGAELTPGLAEARLRRMTEAAMAPELTDEDVADLLEVAKVADRDGRRPSDAAWTPTWFLGRAAAAGWRIKAGRCAGSVDASADGGSLKLSQLHAHCLEMARVYARAGGIVSLPLRGLGGATADDGVGVVNLPERDPGGAGPWPGGAR